MDSLLLNISQITNLLSRIYGAAPKLSKIVRCYRSKGLTSYLNLKFSKINILTFENLYLEV